LNPFQGETHCSAAVENVLIIGMYCFATPVWGKTGFNSLERYYICKNIHGAFEAFFNFKSYHPIPWRDWVSRPITLQALTIPPDHVARLILGFTVNGPNYVLSTVCTCVQKHVIHKNIWIKFTPNVSLLSFTTG
jgi:hypothetical protein